MKMFTFHFRAEESFAHLYAIECATRAASILLEYMLHDKPTRERSLAIIRERVSV